MSCSNQTRRRLPTQRIKRDKRATQTRRVKELENSKAKISLINIFLFLGYALLRKSLNEMTLKRM